MVFMSYNIIQLAVFMLYNILRDLYLKYVCKFHIQVTVIQYFDCFCIKFEVIG